MIICQNVVFVYRTEHMAAGSNRRLDVETNAQTQDADGMQAISVVSMTLLEAVSQQ